MPNRARQKRIIQKAARRYGIRPAVLWGVYGAETNFGRNTNNSSAGAQGPFQFMPDTAQGLGVDPHNFRSAAFGAAKYLGRYKDRGLAGMLAAYNAGPAGNPNNPETRAYIPRVRQLARTWQGGSLRGGSQHPQTRNGQASPFDPGSPADISALVASLGVKHQRPMATAPPAPAFSARNALAIAGTPVESQTGGPGLAQDTGLEQVLSSLRTPGQSLPDLTQPGGGQKSGPLPKSAKADRKLENILREAKHINRAKVPYQWGGGHQAKQIRGSNVTPLDCSGAVSRVLGVNPRVAAQFESWGRPGRGRNVTVYANGEHVLMEINGHFWGTSRSNPGGGAGWIRRSAIPASYLKRFVARHPHGL